MNPATDPIERRLAALPREAASAEFTERVMGRLGSSAETPPEVGSTRHWALAAAVVAAIGAAAVLALSGLGEHIQRANQSARLTEIRRQHELLTRELSDLRSLARSSEPVLYLGSVDDVDYVWDLTPLLEERNARARSAPDSQPASYPMNKERP